MGLNESMFDKVHGKGNSLKITQFNLHFFNIIYLHLLATSTFLRALECHTCTSVSPIEALLSLNQHICISGYCQLPLFTLWWGDAVENIRICPTTPYNDLDSSPQPCTRGPSTSAFPSDNHPHLICSATLFYLHPRILFNRNSFYSGYLAAAKI